MALNNSNLLGIVSNSPRTRAVRSLREWVLDGRLPAGERLPAETRLATKLNVSRSTIRLALSDLEKEGIVSSDKRRRIVLDFIRPNKTFLADAVALITDAPEDFERGKMHGTWHSNFIHTGAVDAIRSAGYDVLNIHPSRIVGDMIQRLILQRPRGVIITRQVLQTASGQHLPQALQEGNVPFVVYGGLGPAHDGKKTAQFDTVASDHEFGSYELTKWLISQGRRRILRLWLLPVASPSGKPEWLSQRDRGYEKAMREAALEPLPALEFYNPNQPVESEDEAFRLQVHLMAGYLIQYLNGPKPIDAIMAVSDSILSMLFSALKLHGRDPNHDILAVGYDNMWQDMRGYGRDPAAPAATVDKKNLEIGRELMNLLQQRIQGVLPPQSQHRLIKPELIILQKS
jgi:DNA-binding LacI/PurR family transcriptional regulator